MCGLFLILSSFCNVLAMPRKLEVVFPSRSLGLSHPLLRRVINALPPILLLLLRIIDTMWSMQRVRKLEKIVYVGKYLSK
eukprot:g12267.t1